MDRVKVCCLGEAGAGGAGGTRGLERAGPTAVAISTLLPSPRRGARCWWAVDVSRRTFVSVLAVWARRAQARFLPR